MDSQKAIFVSLKSLKKKFLGKKYIKEAELYCS